MGKLLEKSIGFNLAYKILPQKGNLVYEYNPFRNYRLDRDLYEYDGQYLTLNKLNDLGITIQDLYEYNGQYLTLDELNNLGIAAQEKNKVQKWIGVPPNKQEPIFHEAGEIVDFITNEFNFDLEHPVDIIAQPSYDDSVNLILNDGKNTPKLINSRFSPIGKNKYQVVDRKGTNDTNLYDMGSQFELDTSLYKQSLTIPKLKFIGVQSGGNLPVGNYHFYFRYVDDDGNETDYVAESGLVSVFIGSTPTSIRSGFRNENSYKIVRFLLSNIDSAYQYVNVYYTRETSDINENSTTSAVKIEQKFYVNQSQQCEINITGLEETTEKTLADINPTYLICENAGTQEIVQNRLFLANVKFPDLDYLDLQDISLRFIPNRIISEYDLNTIDQNYIQSNSNNYYNSTFIYNKVGYWKDDLYRFGIVYILEDGSLSPVFNIRGRYNINQETTEKIDEIIKNGERNLIVVSQDNFIKEGEQYENSKGVCSFKSEKEFDIIGLKIDTTQEVIDYLKTTYKIKGFFFVRQKRMPLTLCQALTIGIDPESNTPILPIKKDILQDTFSKKRIFRNKKTGEIVIGNIHGTNLLQSWSKIYNDIKFDAEVEKSPNSSVYGNDDWECYYGQHLPENDDTCFVAERFIDDAKQLNQEFKPRLYVLENNKIKRFGAICPEYDINSPYYNSLFIGDTFVVEYASNQPSIDNKPKDYLTNTDRHFYNKEFKATDSRTLSCKIQGVEDNIKLVAINDLFYSSRAGDAEEAFRFKYIGNKNKKSSAYNLLRGSFGPYIAISGIDEANKLINIKIPGYQNSNMEDYFKIRFNDKSSFFAISDRIDINEVTENPSWNLYRGDCYICQYTHRVNRNFQDPSAPTNDSVVDETCWAQNFTYSNGILKKENFDKINLGDVNAIQLGMWVTSTYKSTYNLNIRNIDDSITDEVALIGHPRGFFPYQSMSTDGSFKTPEALCFNMGFRQSLSNRYNFEIPDVPAIKNNFSTRILYSNVQIQNAFKNGFRTFEGDNYKDYPINYGSITKILELNSNLLCIFEHGIGLLPISERAMSGEGPGGPIYLNINNILPETPMIISDMYGSQWKDSIIKTPNAVYGVDTIAKKIWVTTGKDFQCISDIAIQEFLNNNITLTERELTPILGIRNVKTHYNAYKGDVMFTFYDNLYGFNEKVWNLCYNETSKHWISFYSWIPSFSENIYNQYFSFDRNCSKWISKLAPNIGSILVDNCIIKEYNQENKPTIKLSISDSIIKSNKYFNTKIEFNIEKDVYGNFNNFDITKDGTITPNCDYKTLCIEDYYRIKDGKEITPDDPTYELNLPIAYDENNRRKWLTGQHKIPVILLNIKAKISISLKDGYTNFKEQEEYAKDYNALYSTYNAGMLQQTIALIPEYNLQFLTTDFWKHGQSGIIDLKDTILPTHWYGKQHPFEFEFVVADNPQAHKIFDNLEIISNNAEPESFHYEIVGDCFNFDKKNMFIRQEATKELFQKNECDISFNPIYKTLKEQQQFKSTIFPLYYQKYDTINEIEDYYKLATSNNKDYSALSGAEIIKYKDEYRIQNHSPAKDIKDVGLLRGNMYYKEDKWDIRINPINIVQKNEYKWDKIPIVYNAFVDKSLSELKDIPDDRVVENWEEIGNKDTEVKVKDKYIKIKIRYNGQKLAIISAINTLYSISYS